MSDCVFCKIISGELPSKKICEDEHVLVIHDIVPEAPLHAIILLKRHVENALEAAELPDNILAHIWRVAAKVAAETGIAESGFRIVNNCGEDACQSVLHFHVHVLGGRKMSEHVG